VHDAAPPVHDKFVDLVPAPKESDIGIKLTPRHYAYLKISEGCNNRCTFCIIPSLRGDLVSRPIIQVLAEAERLLKSGVKEILVISQDTSAYGVDTKYQAYPWKNRTVRTKFIDLCRELGELAKPYGGWVRLHYVYPYPHVDRLIPLMAEGLILPYLDIPLQHADPAVLRAMRRPAAVENTLRRLQQWRALCPELVVRSTFIVGFPGETDAAFETLLDFLEEAELDRVGCFTYSNIAGARAQALPGHVEESVKLDRQEQLMEVQARVSETKLARRVGTRVEVLVDSADGDSAVARSYGEAPEIDGVVQVTGAAGLRAGDRVWVHVTDHDPHDLFASYLGTAVKLD
jgi:ribosomal protein S12 methylthiotransferase